MSWSIRQYHAVGDGAAQPCHAESAERPAAGKGGEPGDHARPVVNNVLLVHNLEALAELGSHKHTIIFAETICVSAV